jgi:7-cyano-7-deazaguanine synthase
MNGLTGQCPLASRSLVLLSGGIDSTVCLALVARRSAPLTVAFDYGQRSRVELDRAERIAASYGSELLVVPLALQDLVVSKLVGAGPWSSAHPGSSYVPGRNLIFLAVTMALAESRALDHVYLGAGAGDAKHYPDCSPEFLDAFRSAADLGLRRAVDGCPVRLRTPLLGLSKSQIVIAGLELGAPLHLTWSCYGDGPSPCRDCPACRLRAETFADLGLPDPALCQ